MSSDALEIVTVSAGGSRFTAWEEVSIEASCRDACRSFTLKAAAEFGSQHLFSVFAAGAPVTIAAGSDLVLTGYVDRARPRISPKRYEITITGRSKGQDLVDCAAVHPTGHMEDVTVADLASALDIFGVGISSVVDRLPSLPKVQIVPGLTVHQTIEPLVRAAAATLMGKADGSVVIWNAARAKKHRGSLVEGVNIEEGAADHNMSGRHSRYIVKGQRPYGSGPDALEIEAIARDAGVARDRPTIIVVEEDTDRGRVKSKARNRRDKAAGKGLSAEIKVAGWRDSFGELWTPGHLVWTESTSLAVVQDMLIETVSYAQGDVTAATLHLVDPRAHGGKAGKGHKSGKAWAMDTSDASEARE